MGHEYNSTYLEDHTDFDESKVAAIAKGATTREEVIGLLGPPSGFFAPPLYDHETIGYNFAAAVGDGITSLQTIRKTLFVSFEGGVVVDVDFSLVE